MAVKKAVLKHCEDLEIYRQLGEGAGKSVSLDLTVGGLQGQGSVGVAAESLVDTTTVNTGGNKEIGADGCKALTLHYTRVDGSMPISVDVTYEITR
ncbi:MAG: hypothetical protein ACHQ1G_03065 [Planctomycetota bacterium]